MSKDVGRPSQLEDKEFLLKIRELVLDYKSEVEMQEILEIPKGTWNTWKYTNFHNFSDIMLSYKHERMLRKAEANVEVLMESEDERVASDISKFVMETVGKKTYSKRVEQTGADGKDLPVPIIQINRDGLQLNNGN
jgi:hypothetical protein